MTPFRVNVASAVELPKHTNDLIIATILPSSPLARYGLVPGNRILRVNGKAPRDYIEYRYLIAEERISVVFVDSLGKQRRVRIEKSSDEDLGISFTSDVFDGIRTCRNRCSFCFVSQLPKGLRPGVYIRDDDYRLSFLHGNFITLTNLTQADRMRIARFHLSPLYVSVHATEPEVRRKLFGWQTTSLPHDERTGKSALLRQMKWLSAQGIEFHTQIVVCSGVNDGIHLERTVSDLGKLYPGVRSIGIVPVGLTKHRNGLPRIRSVGANLAKQILANVDRWQHEFMLKYGTRLVFAADEMYFLAGADIPNRAYYEGFPQLSNGIGLARKFLEGLRRIRPPQARRPFGKLRAGLCHRYSVIVVTGERAAGLIRRLAEKLEASAVELPKHKVWARVCVVENRLLGRSVTTAGLLAGRDIARAVKKMERGDLVLVPSAAVRPGEGFIDGMTVEELASKIGTPVMTAGSPGEAVKALRNFFSPQRRTEREEKFD